MFSSFYQTPIDLIKTKLQTQVFQKQINPGLIPKYVNVRECVRHTINKYGFFSLWRGLTGTIIRNIPANSLYFPGSTYYYSVFIFLMLSSSSSV
jgi:hypothetical protein